MGFFTRRRRSDVELVSVILEGENQRRLQQGTLDAQRIDLEKFKISQEMEHLEAIAAERRKDAEDREKLREQRRKWAAEAREARAKKLATGRAVAAQPGATTCRVCANPGDPTLTTPEILWHSNGHQQRAM